MMPTLLLVGGIVALVLVVVALGYWGLSRARVRQRRRNQLASVHNARMRRERGD